jgi:hypothetical protein
MNSEALGGGVMVAVAAALWVAYLMPTWARRRQYLATERNAVRLQQTLRILAETAEVPEPVRLEANARTVSAQQRLLAQAEEDARVEAKLATDAARAARRHAAAEAAAARHAMVAAIPASPALVLRRLRRKRALSSLVLLAGLVTLASGLVPVVLNGSWLVFGIGAVAVVVAFASLSRFARAARAARVVVAAPRVEHVEAPRLEPVRRPAARRAPAAQTWTPQPVPRPMYLSRGSIAQTAMASVEAANELRRAAAEAELARRAEALAPQRDVTPIARPAARANPGAGGAGAGAGGVGTGGVGTAASRFASMGVVGETEPGMADLDAVLRRRRAVG